LLHGPVQPLVQDLLRGWLDQGQDLLQEGDPKVKKPRGAKLKQIRTAFTVTRQRDPKVLPLILAGFFGPLILFIAAGLVFDLVPYLTFLGILVGLVTAAFVFGKRCRPRRTRRWRASSAPPRPS
jgi:hypothetical protein